mgnify:CR=1 FL=1
MLETTWFVLWGILWAFYFMLDGFDLGIGSLLPFIAKNESDKRTIYKSIGPFWDGNEVWLITAGGVSWFFGGWISSKPENSRSGKRERKADLFFSWSCQNLLNHYFRGRGL